MMAEEYCPTISAFQTHKVANQKPVPVTVYDYYDQCESAQIYPYYMYCVSNQKCSK